MEASELTIERSLKVIGHLLRELGSLFLGSGQMGSYANGVGRI